MKVKELIEKLKEFDGELEVVTYSNCDWKIGTIDDITLDENVVMANFSWDCEF